MENNFVLKEIHLANQKNRDASVKFISLTREPEPTFQYNKKSIKNARLLINNEETNDDKLVEKYKKNLAEKIINEDVDIDINFAGKFIGDIDQIYFNSKSEILYHPPKIMEVLFNNKGEESSIKGQ